jgi:hypothetical protein
MLIASRRAVRGVATVEFFVVAIFALLPILLGTLQICLLLVANHHVDFASFAAARQGAVSNGDVRAMQSGFVQSIVPLFIASDAPIDRDNVSARVMGAYPRAAADVTLFARFRTLSPGDAAQREFAISRNQRRVIPNDALAYRGSGAERDGGYSLHDANLLKVEVTYCQPLIVPFARQLLIATLRSIDQDLWHQYCYASGRVPLRSVGVTPMQSDYWVR